MNWWKIGFFVALIAFEAAREIAVIESDAPPNFAIGAPISYRSPDGGLVSAQGRWHRTDEGEPLEPAVLSIDCWRERGSCVMATTSSNDGYISIPDIRQRNATFTETGAEFTDDWPVCNKLFVRIDAVHNLTTAVRTAKPSKDPMCKESDREIPMRLDGFDTEEHERWRKKHFVPLISLLSGAVGLFDKA